MDSPASLYFAMNPETVPDTFSESPNDGTNEEVLLKWLIVADPENAPAQYNDPLESRRRLNFWLKYESISWLLLSIVYAVTNPYLLNLTIYGVLALVIGNE